LILVQKWTQPENSISNFILGIAIKTARIMIGNNGTFLRNEDMERVSGILFPLSISDEKTDSTRNNSTKNGKESRLVELTHVISLFKNPKSFAAFRKCFSGFKDCFIYKCVSTLWAGYFTARF